MHLPSTAFISGHLDLTEQEFEEHYASKIRKAIENHDRFVIGDARGADSMAQKYISQIYFSQNKILRKTNLDCPVVVYHMLDKPRNNNYGFRTKGGFKNDTERDKQMTLESTYDIAWVRPGKEESGTAKNVNRRNKM